MVKILVVDDEEYIRLLMEDTLDSMNRKDIEILQAEDGQQALDMIKEHSPKIVFLDVMMPRMNGFTVCQIVKKNGKRMKSIFAWFPQKDRAMMFSVQKMSARINTLSNPSILAKC